MLEWEGNVTTPSILSRSGLGCEWWMPHKPTQLCIHSPALPQLSVGLQNKPQPGSCSDWMITLLHFKRSFCICLQPYQFIRNMGKSDQKQNKSSHHSYNSVFANYCLNQLNISENSREKSHNRSSALETLASPFPTKTSSSKYWWHLQRDPLSYPC